MAILLNFKTPKFIGESSVNSRFFLNLGARRFCFFRRSVLLSLLAIFYFFPTPFPNAPHGAFLQKIKNVLKHAAQSGLKHGSVFLSLKNLHNLQNQREIFKHKVHKDFTQSSQSICENLLNQRHQCSKEKTISLFA